MKKWLLFFALLVSGTVYEIYGRSSQREILCALLGREASFLELYQYSKSMDELRRRACERIVWNGLGHTWTPIGLDYVRSLPMERPLFPPMAFDFDKETRETNIVNLHKQAKGSAKCCICFEHKDLKKIPCGSEHIDVACVSCLLKVDECPLCQEGLGVIEVD